MNQTFTIESTGQKKKVQGTWGCSHFSVGVIKVKHREVPSPVREHAD